jgi:hypothetical protein
MPSLPGLDPEAVGLTPDPSRPSDPDSPSSLRAPGSAPAPDAAPQHPLIHFEGRSWFVGEKRRLRSLVEAVEPHLGLSASTDPFFRARWHLAVRIEPVSPVWDETPRRRFNAVRAGHPTVCTASDVDALCAQIQALADPSTSNGNGAYGGDPGSTKTTA